MKKIITFSCIFALVFFACSNVSLSDGDSGTVSIVINESLAQEIRSAGIDVLASRSAGASYSINASLIGDYEAKTSISVASSALAGSRLSFKEIPVGVNVSLILEVKIGNSLIWVGSSSKQEIRAGENAISIALGRVSGVLLWKTDYADSSSGIGSVTVKVAPYGNYTSSSDISLSMPMLACFDDVGNIYGLVGDNPNSMFTGKFSLLEDGSYTSQPEEIKTSSGMVVLYLAYDRVTGVLYGTAVVAPDPDGTSPDDNNHSELVSYKEGSEGFVKISEFSDILNLDTSFVGFVAHNNYVYIASYVISETQQGGIGLYKYQITGADSSRQVTKVKERVLPFDEDIFNMSNDSPSNLLVFQDGALYMLLRRVEFDNKFSAGGTADNYSLGALVKINPDTLSMDTSFGTEGYLGLAGTTTSWDDVVGTSSTSTNTGTVNLTGPSADQEQTHFYGPVGFVAIMPKKLVIADSGFTFSSTENNGNKTLALQKKSRIVTVDLETQAMDIANVSGYYEDEYDLSSDTSGCGYAYITE